MAEEFKKKLKRMAASPLCFALKNKLLRNRLVFELKQKYYGELGVLVPLENGMACPITSEEHWVSYANIFCEREYDALLSMIPLPCRWLDLGCHAGHFTLLLAMRHAAAQQGRRWSALLVDADSRVQPAIRAMMQMNRIGSSQIHFLNAAIAESDGDVPFLEKSYMTSEVATHATDGVRMVAKLSAGEILAAFPPPYDLVKVDIEGGEYPFLKTCFEVAQQTKYLLFEWHSWHPGGGEKAQLLEMAEELGFRLLGDQHSERTVLHGGGIGTAGTVLMENKMLPT